MKKHNPPRVALTEHDLINLHQRAHNAVARGLHILRDGSTPDHARKAIKAIRRALPALGQIGGAV